MMPYLEQFTLASDTQEYNFLRDIRQSYQQAMGCYDHNNVYPFKLFPEKGLKTLEFDRRS